MDARFVTVRTKESNIGNFVCDLMRYYYDGDCCIMAAGTIRGDQIYPPGVLRLRDVVNCFPFEDPVVVMKVTGKAIWDALDNGISNYPALEGRFPQVSNIHFVADYSQPPMSRIVSASIGGEPIDFEREYTLVTRGYMGRGKDGYTSLLIEEEGGKAKEIVSEENGVLISTILRQYFMSLKVVGRWKHWGGSMSRKFNRVQSQLERSHSFHNAKSASSSKPPSPVASKNKPKHSGSTYHDSGGFTSGSEDEADSDEDDGAEYDDTGRQPIEFSEKEMEVLRRAMRKWWRVAGMKGHPELCEELGKEELEVNWTRAIAPRVEGRIREGRKGA